MHKIAAMMPISYSSKTALVVQHAIEFNLEVELKNIILVAFRYFEFLHSQGQSRKSRHVRAMSVSLSGADFVQTSLTRRRSDEFDDPDLRFRVSFDVALRGSKVRVPG
jgi:hypothetical protein